MEAIQPAVRRCKTGMNCTKGPGRRHTSFRDAFLAVLHQPQPMPDQGTATCHFWLNTPGQEAQSAADGYGYLLNPTAGLNVVQSLEGGRSDDSLC